MNRCAVLICLLMSMWMQELKAAGPLGLGIVIAGPTGISANYAYEKRKSLAAGLGWGHGYLHLNTDHLWYRGDLIVIDRTAIDVYMGIGMRLHQERHDRRETDTEIGVRIPVGVSHIAKTIPVQFFGELAPALILVDESAFIIDLALGLRYYF